MWNRKCEGARLNRAFTLLETLLVVALLALLVGLILPVLDTVRQHAESAVCGSNLRQIGIAVMQRVQDNNGVYPYVEGYPDNPVYTPEAGALSLKETLAPYGIGDRTLKCPTDAKGKSRFSTNGSSYDWFSFIAGERFIEPKIYLPAGNLILPLSRFPLAGDYELIHGGRRMNILFADGHVDSYTGPGVREDIKKAVESAGP